MRKYGFSIISLALLFVFTGAVFAQQPTATLTGVVSDPTGAVIPGAIVTATNKATNLARTVTTNSEGVYVIANLPVGEYKVDFDATNFQKFIIDNAELKVGQTLNWDAQLSVGKVSEEFVLDGDNITPIVDTQTSK